MLTTKTSAKHYEGERGSTGMRTNEQVDTILNDKHLFISKLG